MILNHLLKQLNELDEKYHQARVYVEADHGQIPEAIGTVQVLLVDNSSYYLHDDIEKYPVEELNENQINNLLEDGYEYVVVIR